MAAHPLADCYTRLSWAQADGQALADEIGSFMETNPYRARVQMDGGKGAVVFCRVVDPATEAEVFDRLSRLFSSYLDSLRAALNYVTYQVALLDAPTSPGLKPDTVEFPIFRDPRLFSKKNRIKQFPDEHRALFESVQPYDGEREGLWLLHELARIGRHRLVHPACVFPFPREHSLFTDTTSILLDMEIIDTGPLEDGQELVRFMAAAPNGADPKVSSQLAVTIGIDHPLCHGSSLVTVLRAIGVDVEAAVRAVVEAIWPE
ncbi:MAG: hypothetical protein M0Z95_26735 [Actinomycetota bacterium]|nr:hypothetical protein [Actinomycetota bacterium]